MSVRFAAAMFVIDRMRGYRQQCRYKKRRGAEP